MSIHEGHRQRVKTRYVQEGLDAFTDIQVLELLLFYAIPRRDTNIIAHRLLDTFGSFSQVMDASIQDLEKVEGMGSGAAVLVKLFTDVGRYYLVDRSMKEVCLESTGKIADYLRSFYYGKMNEMVYLLCMDAKCRVLCCKKIAEGGINSANVPVAEIVKAALGSNATMAVLSHNHPSGIALPSGEDIHTTRKVAAALATVDVQLVDHIIVGDGDSVSLRDSGISFDDCMIL